MSLSARLTSMVEARVSALLDRVEDPSAVLDHSFERQREALQEVRSSIAETVALKRRLQAQEAELERAIVALDTRARQAVAGGDEQLARAAVERRDVTQTELRSLDAQIVLLDGQHDALELAEGRLRTKVEAFRVEKEALKAQVAAAETKARLAGAATSVGEELADAGLAVRRARARTAALAASAEALAQFEGDGSFAGLSSFGSEPDDLDRRLAALSSSVAVDEALAALRAGR